MSKVLVAPNGLKIRGTLERQSGVALVQSVKEGPADGGRFEIDYSGYTDWWDEEQETATGDSGERLFVDEAGNEWPESQLKLVDKEELEETNV